MTIFNDKTTYYINTHIDYYFSTSDIKMKYKQYRIRKAIQKIRAMKEIRKMQEIIMQKRIEVRT